MLFGDSVAAVFRAMKKRRARVAHCILFQGQGAYLHELDVEQSRSACVPRGIGKSVSAWVARMGVDEIVKVYTSDDGVGGSRLLSRFMVPVVVHHRSNLHGRNAGLITCLPDASLSKVRMASAAVWHMRTILVDATLIAIR